MNWHNDWIAWAPFVFVVALVFINAFFSWLKQRSRDETLREAMRNGRDIDPDILREVDDESRSGGGQVTGGFIAIAVGIALIFFSHQIARVEGDDEIIPILTGAAAFPILIGVVLVIGGLVSNRNRPKD